MSSHRDLQIYGQWLQKFEDYRHESAFTPFLTGEDLIELGYKPGPIFREILQVVEDLQLDGELRTRDEALRHIKINFPLAGKSQP